MIWGDMPTFIDNICILAGIFEVCLVSRWPENAGIAMVFVSHQAENAGARILVDH